MKKKYPFLILLIFLILGIGIFTGIHFSQSIKKQNDTNNRLMENIKNTNRDITNKIQLYNENKKGRYETNFVGKFGGETL